jgi:hypothetical protein
VVVGCNAHVRVCDGPVTKMEPKIDDGWAKIASAVYYDCIMESKASTMTDFSKAMCSFLVSLI